MKKLLLVLILILPLFGGGLKLNNGSILAHTKMMMDSKIDPINKNLKANISMQNNDITTLNGKFWVEMLSFVSDNKDRDEHMQKDIQSNKFKLATYTISSIIKTNTKDTFKVKGKLDFHGKSKELNADAKIVLKNGTLTFKATSKILMSEYGVEMPCMVLMCVRDQVDLVVKASFK